MTCTRTRIVALALMAGVASFCSGCVTSVPKGKTLRSDGIVGWSYKSVAAPAPLNQEPIPVTIQVLTLDRKPSSRDLGMPGGIVRIVPILGLAAPPVVYVNSMQDPDSLNTIDVGDGELEELLASEITKSGLFKQVNPELAAGDYQITGRVNLRFQVDRHLSGLGLLYGATFDLLPAETDQVTCEAHFEVTSRKAKSVVLAKDYVAESRWKGSGVWTTHPRFWSCYGEEVFPKVVDAFLKDIAALPATGWAQ